jgi:hypothetical protein
MATAQDLITRALTSIGYLGSGEVCTGQESADGLVTLNDLLSSLSNEHLMINAQVEETIPSTGAISYTVGVSGNLNTSRPIQVNSAFWRMSGVDYPVTILTKEQYDAIALKTSTSSIVECIYVANEYPLTKIYVYPVASTGGELHINSWKPLLAFATLTTSASFQPGMERALRYLLAKEFLIEYGVVDQTIIKMIMSAAEDAKAVLKRVNYVPKIMKLNLPFKTQPSFCILTGQ